MLGSTSNLKKRKSYNDYSSSVLQYVQCIIASSSTHLKNQKSITYEQLENALAIYDKMSYEDIILCYQERLHEEITGSPFIIYFEAMIAGYVTEKFSGHYQEYKKKMESNHANEKVEAQSKLLPFLSNRKKLLIQLLKEFDMARLTDDDSRLFAFCKKVQNGQIVLKHKTFAMMSGFRKIIESRLKSKRQLGAGNLSNILVDHGLRIARLCQHLGDVIAKTKDPEAFIKNIEGVIQQTQMLIKMNDCYSSEKFRFTVFSSLGKKPRQLTSTDTTKSSPQSILETQSRKQLKSSTSCMSLQSINAKSTNPFDDYEEDRDLGTNFSIQNH